jgi:hypothetical protein
MIRDDLGDGIGGSGDDPPSNPVTGGGDYLRPGLRFDPGPRSGGYDSRRATAPLGTAPRSRRGVLATLIVLMAVFSVAPLLNVYNSEIFNKDYDLWQATGKIVLEGKDIYPRTPGPFPFMYPPACATMLAPISPLPRGVFVAVILMLNSASWTACIVLSVFLATGRVRDNHPGLYLWPSVAVIPFVHDTYLLGQPALLLLALLLGGFACLRRGRPLTAGALIAAAAAIKAYPILAAGYLVYRRRWRALAAMCLTLAALMFVAPLAFRAPARVVGDFTYWVRGMVLKYDEESIGQRPDRAYSFKNQSVQATVHRLARPVLADGEADRRWRVNLLSLDFRATTVLMVGVIAGLGLFYLRATFRADQSPPNDAIEQAMVAVLILFLAPLSFNYSYVWLLYPFTVLLYLALASPSGSSMRRAGLGTVILSIALLALALGWRRTAQAYGNVFFSGLVVLIGLGLILRRGWSSQAATAPTGPSGSPTEAARPSTALLS